MVIVYDLRYELRPEQFSTSTRVVRKLSYEIGYSQADALACISERTRHDLLEGHPRLRDRLLGVVPLGSDHVLTWPRDDEVAPYAIAFGHFPNKNIDLVLDAWAVLRRHSDALPLNIVGIPSGERRAVDERVVALGLDDLVSVLPWLPANEYQRLFASSRVVVFPSDFEGFGLPVVEAMRLGIPVVVTPDPALLEVAGGHAFVVDGATADALAGAVSRALAADSTMGSAATAHAEHYTWRRTASLLRSLALQAMGTPSGDNSEARAMPTGGHR
jgi:glycosyltransferase involved in cell wall biosynthesis